MTGSICLVESSTMPSLPAQAHSSAALFVYLFTSLPMHSHNALNALRNLYSLSPLSGLAIITDALCGLTPMYGARMAGPRVLNMDFAYSMSFSLCELIVQIYTLYFTCAIVTPNFFSIISQNVSPPNLLCAAGCVDASVTHN